jgi:hypothetical protein
MFLRFGFSASLLLAAAPVLAGCSSISGRYVGSPEHGESVGGLPISIDRGRFLKVTYSTATYGVLTGKKTVVTEGVGDNQKETITQDMQVGETHERREIHTEVVTVPEVYAIDVARPFAGSIDYEIEMAEGRAYPSRLKGRVEDKTLEILRDALANVLDQLKAAAGAPTVGKVGEETQVVRLKETIDRVEIRDLATLELVTTFRP